MRKWTGNRGSQMNQNTDDKTTGMTLGQRIKSDRIAAGMSWEQLAAATGMARSSIHRLEGNLTAPVPKSLHKVARALGVDVEDYFVLAGHISGEGLPSVKVYLRSKFGVSDEVASEVEHFLNYRKDQENEPHS